MGRTQPETASLGAQVKSGLPRENPVEDRSHPGTGGFPPDHVDVGRAPSTGSASEREEFEAAVVAYLNAESANVARSLDAFRQSCASRLNGETFLCARPGARKTPPVHGQQAPAVQSRRRNASLLGFSPFYYYPFLFSTAFGGVSETFLRVLAAANRILMEAVVLLDDRIDTDRVLSPLDLHLVDSCYRRSLEMLVPFLPAGHAFWDDCQGLFLEYGRAVMQELTYHRCRISTYPPEEFYATAVGKSGLIKTTVLALHAAAADKKPELAPILRSQEDFLAAFQAYDDLKDWREDYARQNYTALLTSVLQEAGLVGVCESGDRPDVETVGRGLYFSGAAEAQLDLAECLFRRARERVKNETLPLWGEIVTGFLRNTQATRLDLVEIRRRTVRRPNHWKSQAIVLSREEAKDDPGCFPAIEGALRYLQGEQEADGGFSLESSLFGYMNPCTPLKSSRAVTSLILEALGSLPGRLPPIRSITACGLKLLETAAPLSNPPLPDGLERAFGPFSLPSFRSLDRQFEALCGGDTRCDDPLPRDGLFWAVLYAMATRRGVPMPAVERKIETCVLSEDYDVWFLGFDRSHWCPGRALPLFLLYLLARTLKLKGASLLDGKEGVFRERLVAPFHARASWGDCTTTSLSAVALVLLGHRGPELARARERILRGQEDDGSWAPNAFYHEDGRCYGSRALTTAWCAEALSLLQKAVPAERRVQDGTSPTTLVADDWICLHAGVPEQTREEIQAVLCAYRKALPGQRSLRLFAGTWSSMPSRFVLGEKQRTKLAINLEDLSSLLSNRGRPLAIEVIHCCLDAHRLESQGLSGLLLEGVFLAGIALRVCCLLWPDTPARVHSGMSTLDWKWCQGNEWYLREQVKESVLHHEETSCRPEPLILPVDEMAEPAPRNAAMYLGLQWVRACPGSRDFCGLRQLLLWKPEQILTLFRAQCGETVR